MSATLIYDGGRHSHYTSSELERYIRALDSFNYTIRQIGPDDLMELSDKAAQSIAAMWVSPGNENATALATRGHVLKGASMSDFATSSEYRGADHLDKLMLDYLGTYLVRKHLDAL